MGGQVYVSFSGGKDSTVLVDLIKRIYPDISIVFFDTGLEYPEIREFVKTIDNVKWIKPKMTFKEVICKYGYPLISKEQSLYIYEYINSKSEKVKYKRWYGDSNKHYKISEKYKYLIDAPFKISNKCCNIMKKKIPLRHMKKNQG